MKVKVYSGPFCPFCRMVKEWLKQNKIEFEDIDVQNNAETAKYIFEKTGQTAIPVIEVDGQFVVGFDVQKLKKVLGLE